MNTKSATCWGRGAAVRFPGKIKKGGSGGEGGERARTRPGAGRGGGGEHRRDRRGHNGGRSGCRRRPPGPRRRNDGGRGGSGGRRGRSRGGRHVCGGGGGRRAGGGGGRAACVAPSRAGVVQGEVSSTRGKAPSARRCGARPEASGACALNNGAGRALHVGSFATFVPAVGVCSSALCVSSDAFRAGFSLVGLSCICERR